MIHLSTKLIYANFKTLLSLFALGAILLLLKQHPAFATTFPSNWIQTIHTDDIKNPSFFPKSSPDPSDIAYLSLKNTLLVCDAEVDEIPDLFTGDNLFEISRSGVLLNTYSTTTSSRSGYSNEPAGCAFDPLSGHLFISDDAQKQVFELSPDSDGNFTLDSPRTSFSTLRVCGTDSDPEGVAFGDGTLFIIDGINSELYKVKPGPDGLFNGVGETCTSFDTSALVLDPEGVAYDPDTPGHLYVTGNKDENRLIDFTTAGIWARTIDVRISSNEPDNPSGLAAVPKNKTADSKTHIFITDRGVNNSTDSNENDGKIYEFSLPNRPTVNQAPNVSAGFDQITHVSVKAVLNGTVTDEGSFTSVWTQLSGPGTVTFGDAHRVDTTASFSAAGVYELSLKATDTQSLTSNDKVAITVQNGQPFTKIYVSTMSGGTAINSNPSACDGVNSLTYADEDILAYDPQSQCWSMYFDGSDVGLGGDGVDVDAFYRMADGSILLSLSTDGVIIPNNVGAVDDSDIVRFTPSSTGNNTSGTYAWYFDGSDVGLIFSTQDIDAIGFTPTKNLVVSTTGSTAVPGLSNVKDEDLLIFDAASLGDATSGSWGLYFDGSDVELSQNSSEDVNGTWIDHNGDIFLTTLGNFSVTDVSGGGDDIFRCIQGSTGNTTVCTYDFTWDGIGNGLPAGTVLDGIALVHTPTKDDTTPPQINITAPAAVSGTAVTVSANASDNEGVESVQFELDGANLGSPDTTAPYSISWNTTTTANGVHTLTAVATDEAGNWTRSDPVSVTVNNPVNIRVSGNSDDAEERTDTHAVKLNSADLELTLDTVNQVVGIRFNAVAIPKGAIIKNAYIQFNADETSSKATALQIFGQAADNPSTFTTAAGNISSRAKTGASVSWSPAAWTSVGAAGIDQRTPNLEAVIQEIVDRTGWTSGNSLVLFITGDGKGERVAEAFDGIPSAAPLLHIEYQL